MKDPQLLATELQTFFGKGTHDLQNLFQMLHLWLRTADPSDRERATELLRELQAHYTTEIDRLRQSFDELLSLHDTAVSVTSVNVAASLKAALRQVATELAEADAQVEAQVDPTMELRFPDKRLQTAWYVLLDNAVRYRSPDRTLMIRVQAKPTEEGVTLVVRDNGTGIDLTRYQTQVFAPFVRCTDQSEGQGIRLHLLKLMVEQHGGTIKLESEVEQGSTFELYLPHQ